MKKRYYGTRRITRNEKRGLNILYGPIDVDTLRTLYEHERAKAERNYAKDHSFEEWLQQRALVAGRQTPLPGLATK